MNTRQILYWSPRILCILFTIFLSLFALDVFSEGYNFTDTVVALFMHLVPTFIILIALAVAWKKEGVGTVIFIAFSLFILIMSRGESWIISGPLFFIGTLFLLNCIYKHHVRSSEFSNK